MKNALFKSWKMTRTILLACIALASCQLAKADFENPDGDPNLRALHAKKELRYDRPDDFYPAEPAGPDDFTPLPENTLEYPDLDEDHRYRNVFKEIRPRFNDLSRNGRMTAAKAGELLEASRPLLPSEYPPYRIHYWMLFVDLAWCMTPTNGLAQMGREEILAIARNLKLVVDDMDRATIPDFKWYLRSYDCGFVVRRPGERLYVYNGHKTTNPAEICRFMRKEYIQDVKDCINLEQWNLPKYRSFLASTIKSMIAIANATEETP